MTGGELLVDALRVEGVDTVFGLVGSHITAIYDALHGTPGIRVIDARHEQGAAYMADGYARVTGRPGVCLVTAGPGATNTLTAVATAFADSSPVLVIAGQVPSAWIDRGKGVFHECPDQLGMFRAVSAWHRRAESTLAIPGLVREAIRTLREGRPRPAYLEVPCDLLDARVARPSDPVIQPGAPGRVDRDALRRAVELLRASRAPAVWAGGGVIRSGAGGLLRTLAESLGAPVLMTLGGKGSLPADHPLAVDYWLPAPPAQALLDDSDLVLAVGTRFTSMATGTWRVRLPRLVQVDIDPAEIGRNYPVEVGVVGDARAVLGQIQAALAEDHQVVRESRAAAVADARRRVEAEASTRFADGLALLRALRTALDRDAIVVCDITTLGTLARRYFPVYEPRSFICPLGFGTLGSAYPMALGAKAGQPGRQVVAICGDGSFLFNLQEMAAAVQCELGVVAIVVNDGGYGAIRDWQRRHGGGRLIGVDLHTPDFGALAQAFGALALRAKDPAELSEQLGVALRSSRPVLLEVPVTLEHPGFG
ncbi:MAG TPA: thiamine pyrophosphate-binding protein [Methylomirabilota bacterium]